MVVARDDDQVSVLDEAPLALPGAGPETVIADLTQPAVPGEMPPSQIEPDQLARFEEMSRRSRVVRLPDPS